MRSKSWCLIGLVCVAVTFAGCGGEVRESGNVADGSGGDHLSRAEDLEKQAREMIYSRPAESAELFRKSIAEYQAEIDANGALSENNAMAMAATYYDLACAESLAERPEDALANLKRAYAAGFDRVDFYYSDSDLDNVRKLEAFQEWLAEISKDDIESLLENFAKVSPQPIDFSVTDPHGREISLKDYRGKVVLVDCWATWCGPCIGMLPKLKSIHQKYPEDELAMIGLNFENEASGDPNEIILSFLKDHPLPYPCADGWDAADDLPKIEGYPTFLLIDGQGRLRYQFVGAQPAQRIIALIDALQAESTN